MPKRKPLKKPTRAERNESWLAEVITLENTIIRIAYSESAHGLKWQENMLKYWGGKHEELMARAPRTKTDVVLRSIDLVSKAINHVIHKS